MICAFKYILLLNVFIIIILFNKYLFYPTTLNTKDNIDMRINILRKQYKKMLTDKRIIMDVCDNNDKMGSNRDSSIDVGNNCEPWISRECIYVLDHILPLEAIGLEWSSGSSTLWLSYRLKSLISIENNKNWSNMVKNILDRRNLSKRTEINWIDKDSYNFCDNDSKYISNFYKRDTCFKSYVTTNLIPNRKYDFINIDGRARTGCLIRSLKLLKKIGGIIILDNAQRERYKWSYKYIPSRWTKYDFWYNDNLVMMFISH